MPSLKKYFEKPPESSSRESQHQPFRVLIVDDDARMCDYHSALLERSGIETLCISDPLKARDVLLSFQPELLLTDIDMPQCSGLELAAMIRQQDDFAQLPIIFLSSDDSAATRAAALRAGGDFFFSKPVDADTFGDALTERLRRARSTLAGEWERRVYLNRAEHFCAALDQHNIVSVADANGIIRYVNDKFCHVSGYTSEELLGKNHNILNSGHHPREFFSEMWRTIVQGDIWQGEIRNRCKDGSDYWVKSTILPVPGEAGRPVEYVSIRTDITDIKQAEIAARQAECHLQAEKQALIEAREEAERANQAKSHFLSSMSHELRTPMNAILGFAQLLEMEQLAQEQHESVQEISRAGRHLLDLINQVLDLARIEAGRMNLDLKTTSLRSVLDECRSMIEPLLARYRVTLECSIDCCRDVLVQADYTRLKQALINVLSNGCKYNRPDGTLSVNCAIQADGSVRIGIRDTGPGIPVERQAELFEPFHRLGAENSGVEGTGIGLTITRELIESMGGSIDVESAVGEGTTFWLEIPGEQEPEGSSTEAACSAPCAAEVKVGSLRTVLYVEDNPANLRLVSRVLERRPHIDLQTTHDPVLGMELVNTRRFNLLLLDINLPGMNGYELLRRIRDTQAGRKLPVFAISANAMPGDIERGLAAGFDEYLTKPLDIGVLMGLIDHYLP